MLVRRKRGHKERRKGLKVQVDPVGLFVNCVELLVGAGLGRGTTIVPREPYGIIGGYC